MALFQRIHLLSQAMAATKMSMTEECKGCQKTLTNVACDADALSDSISIYSEGSFVFVDKDDPDKGSMRAAGSAPSSVSPVERISNAGSSRANDIIEAKPRDLYMRQLVIMKTQDGRDYVFEWGQIDTGNDAKYMLVGRWLVKILGLKEEPTKDPEKLQGIIGPGWRPRTFVRLRFKMPWLELDWVDVNAYVINGNGNIGFNLGNRAISRFNLLTKLQEQEQDGKEWVELRRRGTESTARPVYPLLSKRSKAQKKKDAMKHQENGPLAAECATYREQWQIEHTTTYAPSESSDAYTAASTSHVSTELTTNTYMSLESLEQERKI